MLLDKNTKFTVKPGFHTGAAPTGLRQQAGGNNPPTTFGLWARRVPISQVLLFQQPIKIATD